VNTLALRWSLDNKPHLSVLDQQLLPQVEKWIGIHDCNEMIAAIKALKVRGAPLIGVSAALSLAQSALDGSSKEKLLHETAELMAARPTAVNLMNCVNRLKKIILTNLRPEVFLKEILIEALAIAQEDFELCDRMANYGAALIDSGDSILTHCNSGALATAGVGTALGVIRRAHELGKKIHVYVDETRPLLQGARLTAWELDKFQIPYTLITDNMAAHVMSLGKINKIFVGCDRIAVNGDFANKIGTYGVAVCAHYHQIPFYVVGPQTTVDSKCLSGAEIPIEQRHADEVRGASGSFGNVIWSQENTPVYNPSFDVTPAKLVTAWVLDTGVLTYKNICEGALK
jgi:methylthioribose-1-phosphate isomerase